jgi:hypothetical protein
MTTDFSDDFTFMDDGDWFIFECWRRGDHVAGTQRQDYGNEQLQRFSVIHRFNTSYGGFIIVSDDPQVDFNQAVFFAKAFAFGKVVHYRIDLKSVSQ